MAIIDVLKYEGPNDELVWKTFSDKPVEVDEDITDTQLIENVFLD